MAWVNVLDIASGIEVAVSGVFSVVGNEIHFDTGVQTGNVSGLGSIIVTAPGGADLPDGLVTGWRISSVTITTFPTPPAYFDSFNGNLGVVFADAATAASLLESSDCYGWNYSQLSYGYAGNADLDDWNGPAWGPDIALGFSGCMDPPLYGVAFVPIASFEIDISTIGDNGGPFEYTTIQGSLILEVDYTAPPGQGLVKDALRYIDPGQSGQSAIAPHTSCTTVPDDPPGNGDAPPPGGGGPGSGPPEGDLPVCIFQWVEATDEDGNPVMPPTGAWIPINAPCTGH